MATGQRHRATGKGYFVGAGCGLRRAVEDRCGHCGNGRIAIRGQRSRSDTHGHRSCEGPRRRQSRPNARVPDRRPLTGDAASLQGHQPGHRDVKRQEITAWCATATAVDFHARRICTPTQRRARSQPTTGGVSPARRPAALQPERLAAARPDFGSRVLHATGFREEPRLYDRAAQPKWLASQDYKPRIQPNAQGRTHLLPLQGGPIDYSAARDFAKAGR